MVGRLKNRCYGAYVRNLLIFQSILIIYGLWRLKVYGMQVDSLEMDLGYGGFQVEGGSLQFLVDNYVLRSEDGFNF